MDVEIDWIIKHIRKCGRLVEFNGEFLSRSDLKILMTYGKNKGYRMISEFDDDEIHRIVTGMAPREGRATGPKPLAPSRSEEPSDSEGVGTGPDEGGERPKPDPR